jgi:4-amino-4-deoxy-L-arabinose transferase-like glycosyltransferase
MSKKQSELPRYKGFHSHAPLLIGTILFTLSLGLRLIGIQWGLPDAMHHVSFHPDEWLILLASYYNMNPLQGDFLPGFYNYGSLPLMLWSLWLHILIPGAQLTVDAFASLHLLARILTALMGALTTAVIFQTGRHLGGLWAGIIAALVAAIAPAHVVHSRFQTVDVPTTLFVALAGLCAVRLYDSPHLLRTLLWGTVWAGCAAGSKYNAGLVILALWVSLYLRARTESHGIRPLLPHIGISMGVALLTFLIACPGAWLDREAFWRNFMYEVRHVQAGHGDVFIDTGLGWIYHLRNLIWGFGLLPLLISAAGWFIGWKLYPSARGILIAALLYYLLIGAAEVRFLRYTFPLYPALALGIGLFTTSLHVRRFRPLSDKRKALAFLAALILIYQGSIAIGFTFCMTTTDTRIRCVNWFREHVPEEPRSPLRPCRGSIAPPSSRRLASCAGKIV